MMQTTNSRPATLVITATISPPTGMPGSVRNDSKLRLEEYCQGLVFYLRAPSCYINRILFLENSDSDLSRLHQVTESIDHDKKVEFISFVGDYQPELGKATGEFQMLDYGLSQCSFLSDTDILWKVTGRLQILNIARLVATAPTNYTVYCDLRDVPFIGDLLGGNQWMDMRLFSCTVEAYNRLLRDRSLDLALTHGSPEKTLFSYMRQKMHEDKKIIPRFRVQPHVQGFSGYRGVSYQSLPYKVKEMVRVAARRVTPRLWV